MPLTEKGEEIMSSMKKEYGAEKGEQVFYASANKGTITGVHHDAIPEASAARSGTGNPQMAQQQNATPDAIPEAAAPRSMPQPPVQPATPVSGYTGAGQPAPRDSGGFSLPEQVTFDDIKAASRRPGGW